MSTVVEKVQVILAEVGTDDDPRNHNKVWYGTLFDNQDVLCEWGRVGKKLQSKMFPGAGASFLRKKEAEKLKKGYTSLGVVEGSEHVKTSTSGSKSVSNGRLKDIAKNQIKHSNPLCASLLDYLTQENVHTITSATKGKITYNDTTGQFSTVLGIIDQGNIDEANNLLVSVGDHVANGDYGSELASLTSQYLRLVPTDIGMRRLDIKTFWSDLGKVQAQKQIVDALQASLIEVTSGTAKKGRKKKAEVEEQVFNVQLELIEDTKVVQAIDKKYKKTRQRQHQASGLDLKKVYSVEIASEREAFAKDGSKLTNVWELWHGSQVANCLSIMKQGLIIPPSSSGHVTGRLYGDGVYASDISSKALNYATSAWGGRNTSRTFMFLLDMAMGKHYNPNRGSYMSTRYPAKGYDSTFAKAGSGVLNNEMIVYRTSQVQIKYLCEFG